MSRIPQGVVAIVKVYHGYGRKDSLIVYGHGLAAKAIVTKLLCYDGIFTKQ